jgi:hypothetical protein
MRGVRGPILPGGGLLYVPSGTRLRLPVQFYFANCNLWGLQLTMILDNLKRVDVNSERDDDGVLLQFASVQDAVMFKMKWI